MGYFGAETGLRTRVPDMKDGKYAIVPLSAKISSADAHDLYICQFGPSEAMEIRGRANLRDDQTFNTGTLYSPHQDRNVLLLSHLNPQNEWVTRPALLAARPDAKYYVLAPDPLDNAATPVWLQFGKGGFPDLTLSDAVNPSRGMIYRRHLLYEDSHAIAFDVARDYKYKDQRQTAFSRSVSLGKRLDFLEPGERIKSAKVSYSDYDWDIPDWDTRPDSREAKRIQQMSLQMNEFNLQLVPITDSGNKKEWLSGNCIWELYTRLTIA